MQNFFGASPARSLESTNLNRARGVAEGRMMQWIGHDGWSITVTSPVEVKSRSLDLRLTPQTNKEGRPLDLLLSSLLPDRETDANRWENFYSRSVVKPADPISVTKSSQLIKMSSRAEYFQNSSAGATRWHQLHSEPNESAVPHSQAPGIRHNPGYFWSTLWTMGGEKVKVITFLGAP